MVCAHRMADSMDAGRRHGWIKSAEKMPSTVSSLFLIEIDVEYIKMERIYFQEAMYWGDAAVR